MRSIKSETGDSGWESGEEMGESLDIEWSRIETMTCSWKNPIRSSSSLGKIKLGFGCGQGLKKGKRIETELGFSASNDGGTESVISRMKMTNFS